MDSPLNLNTQEARCVAHLKITNSSPPADLPNVNAEEAKSDDDSMTALI